MQIVENRESQWTRRKKALALFFVFIGIIVFYQLYIRGRINREGVYTVATVVKSEGRKGGVQTSISYFLKGKPYTGLVNAGAGFERGDKYFIKILSEDPKAIIFLEDNPVPPCLWNVTPSYDGWKNIPVCSN